MQQKTLELAYLAMGFSGLIILSIGIVIELTGM